MRVILNATGYNPALAAVMHRHPSPMLRIVDKPIIVHIIERLVLLGVRRFEIVLSHLPQQIEEYLQEGQRWGIQIAYHIVREPGKPFAAVIPAAHNWPDEAIVLGHAEVLPKLHAKQLNLHSRGPPILFFHGSRGWIGWGVLSANSLRKVDRLTPFFALTEQLKGAVRVPVSGVLFSVQTLHDWHASNHRVLRTSTPKNIFPSTARMVEPGIWISRATILHPTAVIRAPVFIGENCQVMEDTQVGPDVVVENHCIVDKSSTIVRSLVCQESYVGEGLEVYHDIIDQRTLINLAIGASVSITDDFILGHVEPPYFRLHMQKGVERCLAGALLLLVAPLVAWMSVWRGVETTAAVRLPAGGEPHSWKTFPLQRFASPKGHRLARLAALLNVVRGELHFVGLVPRTHDELFALPVDRRRLVLESKLGWLTLSDVEPQADAAIAESYYVTHQGPITDLRLLGRYLRSFLTSSGTVLAPFVVVFNIINI